MARIEVIVPVTGEHGGLPTTMNLSELQTIVAAGECPRVELKRSTGELRRGVQTLCAFLNGKGGRVVFGVAPDGEIVGQQVSDKTMRDVAQELAAMGSRRRSSERSGRPWS